MNPRRILYTPERWLMVGCDATFAAARTVIGAATRAGEPTWRNLNGRDYPSLWEIACAVLLPLATVGALFAMRRSVRVAIGEVGGDSRPRLTGRVFRKRLRCRVLPVDIYSQIV